MEKLYDIKGVYNYKVTESGKIFSTISNKYLTPYLHDNRYYRIGLSQNGILFKKFVHVIVCTTFHPNPENKPQVNHKDGNKLNNHYLNLEWVTGKENIDHALLNNLYENVHGGNHYEAKKVINTITGEVFETIEQASVNVIFDVSYFRKMLSGKYKNKTNFKLI